MTTRSSALVELRKASRDRTPCVLATVVRTLGSAYLGSGARMVIHADGSTAGMVSGGCLEVDLAARMPEVIASGVPRIASYDARSPDDLVWGLGLGCEGLVDVFLEPLAPDDAGPLADFLERSVDDRGATVVAMVYRAPAGDHWPHPGARFALGPSGVPVTSGGWGDGSLLPEVSRECGIVGRAPDGVRGWSRDFEAGMLGLAFEILQPPVHLVVCGTGPDASSLARLAHGLGWRCTIVGTPPDAPGRRARFPHARLAESLEAASDLFACEHRTAAIVMSHRYERDLACLQQLLGTGMRYIGVLGPRRRTDRMLAELSLGGGGAGAGMRARVHGPAGLDIGGEGPELIALAIVAEVAAVMHGRDGRPLRERDAPIHGVAAGGLDPDGCAGAAGESPGLGALQPRASRTPTARARHGPG